MEKRQRDIARHSETWREPDTESNRKARNRVSRIASEQLKGEQDRKARLDEVKRSTNRNARDSQCAA